MFYLTKIPWLIKKLYPHYTWDIPTREKVLYLTFDDGPHPVATPFVLDTLKAYDAKATFFCIGKNVQAHTGIYKRILLEGHKTGNHTQNHLNGWKTTDPEYFENTYEASRYIDTDLFRPPYGRITRFQAAMLTTPPLGYKIIMWDVLSGDFDTKRTGSQCASKTIRNARKGSIIVLHDSEKAFDRVKHALPEILHHFCSLGFTFETIKK